MELHKVRKARWLGAALREYPFASKAAVPSVLGWLWPCCPLSLSRYADPAATLAAGRVLELAAALDDDSTQLVGLRTLTAQATKQVRDLRLLLSNERREIAKERARHD